MGRSKGVLITGDLIARSTWRGRPCSDPDTHALVWLAEGHPAWGQGPSLGGEALATMTWGFCNHVLGNAMLHQRGRIQLMQPVEA